MSAFTVVVLALSLVTGVLASAKQSGAEPSSWLPYTAPVAAFAVAALASLQASGSLSASAIVAAVLAGLQASGLFAAGHALLHLTKQGKDAGGSGAPANQNAVEKAASKLSPPSSKLIGGFALGCLVAVLVCCPARPGSSAATSSRASVVAVQSEGCAWWNSSGGATVVQQGAATLSCELAQAEAAGTVDTQTLLACVGNSLSDLVADLVSLVTYYTSLSASAASLPPSTMVCAAPNAAPPYAAIPKCVSAGVLLALENERDKDVAALADGGGR